MTDLQAICADLYRMQVDYWYEVDHNYGRNATDFYLKDGLFVVGTERMAGQAEIAAFYKWREQRGARTARHVVANHRLSHAAAGEAEFQCIMVLYADDGVPVLPSQAPVMIADVVDHCVLDGGVWKFRSHVLKTVFQGGAQPTIPTRSELITHKAGAMTD